ncbi:MAG: hypothetical protein LBE80_01855 [Deltaproteobacteria bacterium]|nr:hypothetical protein [Deltaproteobacteria bacterium]
MVLFIGIMVTGLAFTIFRSSTGRFLSEEAALGLQRNLRGALASVIKEARMAGNGLTLLGPRVERVEFFGPTHHKLDKGQLVIERKMGWFKLPEAPGSDLGVMGIYGTDGGPNGADSLTIFRSEIEKPSALGRLESFKSGELKFEAEIDPNQVKTGDIVAATMANRAVLFEIDQLKNNNKTLSLKAKGRFTGSALPKDFQAEGALVFNLRKVAISTYFVNEKNSSLMVDNHDQTLTDYDDPISGARVLAENVSDLQIYYFFENDSVELSKVNSEPGLSYQRFLGEKVKAVAVALTCQGTYNSEQAQYKRPALFNRLAGNELGSHKYSSLMETVFLRN